MLKDFSFCNFQYDQIPTCCSKFYVPQDTLEEIEENINPFESDESRFKFEAYQIGAILLEICLKDLC